MKLYKIYKEINAYQTAKAYKKAAPNSACEDQEYKRIKAMAFRSMSWGWGTGKGSNYDYTFVRQRRHTAAILSFAQQTMGKKKKSIREGPNCEIP